MIEKDLSTLRFNIPALEQLFSYMAENGLVLRDYQGDTGFFEKCKPEAIIYKLPFTRDVDNSTAESRRFHQGLLVCTNRKRAICVFMVSAENETLCATGYNPQQLKKAVVLHTAKRCVLPILLCACACGLLTAFWNFIGSVMVVFGAILYSAYSLPMFLVVALGTLKLVLIHVEGIRVIRGIGKPLVHMQSYLQPCNKKKRDHRIMGIACGVSACVFVLSLFQPLQLFRYEPSAQTMGPAPALSTFIELNETVDAEQHIELMTAKASSTEGFQSDLTMFSKDDAGRTGELYYSCTYIFSPSSLKLDYVFAQSKRGLAPDMLKMEKSNGTNELKRREIQVVEDGYFYSLVQTDTSVLEVVARVKSIPGARLVSRLPEICRDLQWQMEQQSVFDDLKE